MYTDMDAKYVVILLFYAGIKYVFIFYFGNKTMTSTFD